MRDALATHLEKLMAGRSAMARRRRSLAARRFRCRQSSAVSAAAGSLLTIFSARIAERASRWPASESSATLRAARPTAKLVVAGTTELDASFVLQKDSNLVGRTDPHSNIFPEIDLSRFDPETKVSRRHARIWREGDTFLVEDLGFGQRHCDQ